MDAYNHAHALWNSGQEEVSMLDKQYALGDILVF